MARWWTPNRLDVGWVLYHYPRRLPAMRMGTFPAMRYANLAAWVNRNDPRLRFAQHRPGFQAAAVVFLKMMNADCQAELTRQKERGALVVFDANVNYYKRWGDYTWAGASPTDEQREQAEFMTREADLVVADSAELADICRDYNPKVVHVPDNVDMRRFSGARRHQGEGRRLIWSGVSVKAGHLLAIKEVLAELDCTLVVVSEARPALLDELERVCRVEFRRFSLRTYPQDLLSADVIISPRYLNNAYDLCHTEYKIALGMAVGLPAAAAPQRSYREALAGGGGFICEDAGQWHSALSRLMSEPELRQKMGDAARATVREHYATPVVAARYAAALRDALDGEDGRGA